MVQINEDLTRRVAQLARLELSELEVKIFTPQLGEIIQYVDQLQSVDVTQLEPLTHPFELDTPLRPDVIRPTELDAEGKPKVLSCGPDVLQDGYKVPQIL